MDDYQKWEIGGHTLEFIEDEHCYLCDGVILPSITQILKTKFGKKYEGIDTDTLKRASEKGTELHLAIEDYCKTGKETDLIELRNFKFLQNQYGFNVIENEVPVILSVDDEPVCAGRLDMVVMLDDQVGIADIKRTSALDKDYLAYQLNLYRIAYRQTYGIEADFLRAIHLREDVRKFVNIPINEPLAMDLVYEYMRGAT